jgi:hypothetical protein
MKVLKNNYTGISIEEKIKRVEPYPRKLICELCGSELEYEQSDLRMGAYGCVYIDCPCCNHDNMIENHENEITLTMDNVEFPTHFHRTSEENGAVDVCNNDEIRRRIQSAIEYFRKNKDEFVWYSECGNLFLVVFRYEGDEDYEIILTDNYYSTYINFEDEDYK